jgi:hypothetical protein
METTLQAETFTPTDLGGEDMAATFNAVGLRAVRDPENRNVVVHVDVELTTGAAAIGLHRVPSEKYSDGSALVCELTVTGAGSKSHSRPEPFPNAYGREYVVLMYEGAVIGVAPIRNG